MIRFGASLVATGRHSASTALAIDDGACSRSVAHVLCRRRWHVAPIRPQLDKQSAQPQSCRRLESSIVERTLWSALELPLEDDQEDG